MVSKFKKRISFIPECNLLYLAVCCVCAFLVAYIEEADRELESERVKLVLYVLWCDCEYPTTTTTISVGLSHKQTYTN